MFLNRFPQALVADGLFGAGAECGRPEQFLYVAERDVVRAHATYTMPWPTDASRGVS